MVWYVYFEEYVRSNEHCDWLWVMLFKEQKDWEKVWEKWQLKERGWMFDKRMCCSWGK